MTKTKLFLTVLAVLGLSACVSSGGNPWNRSSSAPAASAPSPLAYDYGTDSPENTQAQPQQQAAYPRYNGTLLDNTQTPSYDAAQQQQQNAYYNGAQQGAYPPGDSGMAAPAPAASEFPPIKVGLLVPLSGKSADLGQAMLQAAQLALFDMGYNSFELIPRDTKTSPDDARRAAQSAIENGAQLILGPLFAGSVQGARPVAAHYGVNMVAFSTDWTLTDNNTFIMGFLPFVQIERVVAYAASQGIRDVGIVAPDTAYGNAVVSAFNAAAYRSGMRVVDTMIFNPSQKNLAEDIKKFAKYDDRKAQHDAQVAMLEERLKAAPGDAQTKQQLFELKRAGATQNLPFQAVFMPVGGEQARSIASLFSQFDMPPSAVRRLGTGLWDDPGLVGEPALKNGLFAASAPNLRSDFERRYAQLYGHTPPRLATLAYDATALASVLARKGYSTNGQPAFDRASITNPNGFAGVDGIFRFRPDGLVERGLAVLQLNDGDIGVVEAPPTTFQKRYGSNY